MARNDGGPAFPVTWENDHYGYSGMTLRDWFAGQYLAGNGWSCGTFEDHVRDAYRAADAMLVARNKEAS